MHLPNRVIFHPVFIPVYVLLVVGLTYYSAMLAWGEISSSSARPFPWLGLSVVGLGVGFVQYYNYTSKSDLRPYTRRQVLEKTSVESGGVWLVVNKDVYDVTRFVRKHPPGAGLILRQAGTDATRHYDYHLESTKHFWRQSKIGWLVEDEDENGEA